MCPSCGAPKSLFERSKQEMKKQERILKNAVCIAKDNQAIERVIENCIDCGLCAKACMEKEGISNLCDGIACVQCGQCIQVCPTKALRPKQDKDKFLNALANKKICIAYTSPSVRVAIGEGFGMPKGSFVQGKLVSALRKLGFTYVLDVTFGADLTILEEASELIDRIKNQGVLPMFTSCCPAWVKYAEQYYQEILPHISTCKSPIGMQGEIVRNYFTKKHNITNQDIFTVAITPCTAKKYEIARDEIGGTDCVLTTQELIELLREKNIDFNTIEEDNYDSLLKEGSGAGMIFGVTGGVMEAALRTAYYLLTKKELPLEKIEFHEVRGMKYIKEATIDIEGLKINVAIIHKMSQAKEILEEVKNKTSKYHYIEIMNCEGGCIGGGGQPKSEIGEETETKEQRINSLYAKDKKDHIRVSHQNEEIKKVYEELLEKPLSKKAEELLHTKYEDKSKKIQARVYQEV